MEPAVDTDEPLPSQGSTASPATIGPGEARLSSLRTLSTTLWVAGQVLLFSYVVAVLTSIWPLQLLDPGWRLNAATNLIDNGGIALIGLVCIHLAAQLDSRNLRRQARRQRIARLALTAMAGFLFLVPLHVLSSLQLFEQLKSNRVSRLERATYRLRALSADVAKVQSHEELKTRLLNFQGQTLSPRDLAQPLPELKRVLRAQIQEAIRRIDAQVPPPGWNQARPMVLTNLRLGFTSLALAVGFAAAGRRRGHNNSLLEELGAMQRERLEAIDERRRSREAFLKSVADARLEQQFQDQEAARQGESDASASDAASAELQPPGSTDIPATPAPRRQGRRGIDLDYFEQLSQESDAEKAADADASQAEG